VALVIFVPVVLLGAGLPSIIAVATQRSSELRSNSGRLLFWNTLGSSAGSFVAGYGLLPFLGLHWSLLILALGSLGMSVAAQNKCRMGMGTAGRGRGHLGERGPVPASTRAGYVLPAISLAGIVLFFAFREDIAAYTVKYHGYGRDPDIGNDPDALASGKPSKMPLIDLCEGPLTTSFVFENDKSLRVGSGNVCLAVAYKKAISSQAIQGHLPALFYPGGGLPERCLGICLGSGQSFGSLLLYPIKSLDVVDISTEIIDLCRRHFAPYNHDLLADPRVRVYLDDGRHFVERAPNGYYDVVSMEPPPPTAEGVCSLYSVEFYEQISRVLADGGVFMQWLPLYRVTPLDARGIIKTQAHVFPETFVVKSFASDFMVVSYKSRPRLRLDAIARRSDNLKKERLVAGVRWSPSSRYDIASLQGVLSLIIMGPKDVCDMDAPVIYRDDTQILSYSSGDRWLLRRYEGPALSKLTFAALRLTEFETIKDYFDPPLSPDLIGDVEAERTASLVGFNVPDPKILAANRVAMANAANPADRARLALALAAGYDGMLAKEEAYRSVEQALDALNATPDLTTEEHLEIGRGIVRNCLVAYEPLTADKLERFEKSYRDAPLLRAMREEFEAYRRRQADRLSDYWLP